MTNKNYLKGIRLERAVVDKFRDKGHISFRSAGSHSKIDVVDIDTKNKRICFYQCKKGKNTMTKKQKEDFIKMSDEYIVLFEIINEVADRRKKIKINKLKGGKN